MVTFHQPRNNCRCDVYKISLRWWWPHPG